MFDLSNMINISDDEIDFQDDWSDIWWDSLDDFEIISDCDLSQDAYSEFDDLPELIPFDTPESEDELNLDYLDEHIKTPTDNEWIRAILISLEYLISTKLRILEDLPINIPG